MDEVRTFVVGAMILGGAFFTLVAAIGLVRLGDVYMRMHAASKAGTLGSGLLLLSIAVDSSEIDVIARAIIGVVFFLLTAPVSAHLLARAAYKAGVEPLMRADRDGLRHDPPGNDKSGTAASATSGEGSGASG